MDSTGRTIEQQRAIRAVLKAVRSGKLIRPSTCSLCGDEPPKTKNGRARIQGHHHRGYSKENHLDVQWVCPSCHKKIHPNSPKALAKIANGNKGNKRSMDSRAKQSASTKGITGEKAGWTPERRERQKQKMLDHWSNQENRNAQSESVRKSWESR